MPDSKKTRTDEATSIWVSSQAHTNVFEIPLSLNEFLGTFDRIHEKIAAHFPVSKECYGFSVLDGNQRKEVYFGRFSSVCISMTYVSKENPLKIKKSFPVSLDSSNPETFQTAVLSIPFEEVNKAANYDNAQGTLNVLSDYFLKDFNGYKLESVSVKSFKELLRGGTINATPVFCYREKDNISQASLDALKTYKTVAAVLCEDPFVKDLKRYLLSESNVQVVDKDGYITKRIKGKNSTSTCLVLPSMTGKTQVALSLGYGAFYFNYNCLSQTVYGAFDSISSRLIEAAMLDLKKYPLNTVVTATMIKELLRSSSTKSYLGGYIVKLVQKMAEEKVTPECSVEQWIDFNCNLQVNEFPAYTGAEINRLIEGYHDKLIFILDEFPYLENISHFYTALFIRNFLRYLGLSCLVVGTNTKVSNLIGKASGASPDLLPWNDLLHWLPGVKLEIILSLADIGQYFVNIGIGSDFEDFLPEIVADAVGKELDAFCNEWCTSQYAQNVFEARAIKLFKVLVDQIRSSRPGIGVIIATALSTPNNKVTRLENDEGYSQCVNDLFGRMCERLFYRKPLLQEIDSLNGHLAIMMSNYITSIVENLTFVTGLVNNHLFYLEPYESLKQHAIKFGGQVGSLGVPAIKIGEEVAGIRIYYNPTKKSLFVRDRVTFQRAVGGCIPPPEEELLTFIASYWGSDLD